jgi:hypothetical protein
VFDGISATRLPERPGFAYGAFDAKIDANSLLNRAMPQT